MGQAQSGGAAAQANATLTLRNWHIGRMIDVEVLKEGRAGYDQEIVATLSPLLSWSHFREIVALPHAEARSFYANEAAHGTSVSGTCATPSPTKAFDRREIAGSQIPEGSAVPLDAFRDPMLLAVHVFAGRCRDQIELLELHKDGIVVAEYWTTSHRKYNSRLASRRSTGRRRSGSPGGSSPQRRKGTARSRDWQALNASSPAAGSGF
ncbi:MAG: hypothetical protein CSA84_00300 [Actinomycetales bacterium]|nr:MAG: hypothetical protein CSA84_00300 [Actinomycetales bacterium]